jgi:hypothetical protein
MAAKKTLKLIQQGVEAWNVWRKSDDKDKYLPDLRNADLRKINLQGINLTTALLEDANFSQSDLCLADFSGSALAGAKFDQTLLIGARFCDYHNEHVVVGDGIIIIQCPIAALFGNVDFHRAVLHRTEFIDMDLSETKHLDTCIHLGPSILSGGTLLKSKSVPLVFLRGCGLPENFITGLPLAHRFYSVFISYSSDDEEFVSKLHRDLQEQGVRCWFAPKDMQIGDMIRLSLDQAIKEFDRVLLVLSTKSMASQWVEQEVEKALEKERQYKRMVLMPIRIDDFVFQVNAGWASYLKNTRNIGDFRRWNDKLLYQEQLERLLTGLTV